MPTAVARNACRPNAARRFAYLLALLGRPCAACGLPIAWDGAQPEDVKPGSAVRMHLVDVRDCKRYDTDVIVAGCHTCNDDAMRKGVRDITADCVSAPYSLPAQKVADAIRATWMPEDASDLPDATARREARTAKGIAW